ncbi:flagellar assembly peptidoglycan hydrolase FlgJ [Novilysobacter erysipheiresistens]
MLLRSATAMPLNATEPSRDRLQTAARELEAQFAQLMLKSMRSTSFGDSLLGDNNTMYRDMYDQKLSRELTKGDGLGLAPMIVHQLERQLGHDTSTAPTTTFGHDGGMPLTRNLPLARPLPTARPAPMALPDTVLATGNTLALAPSRHGVSLGAIAPVAAPVVTPLAPAPNDAPGSLDCSSPEAFVRSIWPQAQRTAAELGVSPKALVAQAALETGWGRRLVGGNESHNLFGIKATGGWDGKRVDSATHEFINGVRRNQHAEFRGYRSIDESFDDYARLMRNDRYAGALAAGDDPDRFAHALQQAGYATDPSYAAKISAIVDGPTLQRALGELDAPDETHQRAYAALPATTPRG